MKKEKYYLVYQITNKLNKMVYIGVHVTHNINDDYMGSGKYIKRAINKYGFENFEKVILYQFDNEQDMFNKEAELVNEEFILNRNTYNIVLGGNAGFINHIMAKDKNGTIHVIHKNDPRFLSGELVGHTKGRVTVKDKDGIFYMVDINDPRYLSGELKSHLKNFHNNESQVLVKDKYNKCCIMSKNDPRYLSGEFTLYWKGRKHSQETINKMKQKDPLIGDKNGSFGTCWIYNNTENKKIKKDELEKYLKIGWLKGRKQKRS